MRYILYSPEHEFTIPGIEKTNGEVIPERTYTMGPRALYYLRKFPERRYRQEYPAFDSSMALVKCKTYEEAEAEQENLENYCGETFEIHEYVKGQIGPKVVKCPADV